MAFERLQQADLDHQHHRDLHDGPGEHLVHLDQVGRLAQATRGGSSSVLPSPARLTLLFYINGGALGPA